VQWTSAGNVKDSASASCRRYEAIGVGQGRKKRWEREVRSEQHSSFAIGSTDISHAEKENDQEHDRASAWGINQKNSLIHRVKT